MIDKKTDALKLALEVFEIAAEGGGVDFYAYAQDIREALAEQPAQQEPFAYAYTGIKHNGEHHGPHLVWKPAYMDAMSASMGAVAVPLYTSPPASKPWVGLTDDERGQIINANFGTGLWSMAKDIEAKLKEKNA